LGFFFLIPAYLSLPSENIFSEQKSRTWRYCQFERISNFYNYNIIFTGHTSTDRIETILIQLLRGTSTRGLSTLNWKRTISRNKTNILPLVRSPQLSFLCCAPRQNNKVTKFFKKNNVLFCIEFPNQFFLKFQINFLRFCFSEEKNTTQAFFNQKVVFKFSKMKNIILPQKQSFQSSKQRDKLYVLTPYTMLQSVLFFEDYKKSRYRKLINNTITRQTSNSNFFLKKILVRKKIYLLQKIKLLRPIFQSRPKLSKKSGTVALQTKPDYKITNVYLAHFSIHFVRCSPFITTRTCLVKKYLDPDKLSTRAKKVKFFFSKNYKVDSQISYQTKSKSFFLSKKHKYSFFHFETVILNKKPSKILIKYLKRVYWVQFKKKITELAIGKLKNILTFQTCQCLIKPDFFPFKYPQAESALFLYKKDFKSLKVSQGYKTKTYNFIKYKNSTFSLSSNSNLKSKLLRKSTITTQKQKKQLNDSSSLNQQSLNKKNILKKSRNKVNFPKSIDLSKSKDEINFQQSYFKYKTKNSLDTNSFIWNIKISKLRDDILFPQNRPSFIHQMTNNFQLSLPNQKAFGHFKGTDKQCFIVRPILFISRFDLKKICAFWELPLYPDQTNEKLIYFRNRIRKQLLPLLRFFFNPQIDKLFLQFAEIATAEQRYLDVLSSRLKEEFQIEKTNASELNVSVFIFIPIAIQRRLLKQFLDQYLIKKVKFFHIQNLLTVLAKRKKQYSNTYVNSADNVINFKNFTRRPETMTKFSFRGFIIFKANKKKERFSIFHFNESVFSVSLKSQFLLGNYWNNLPGRNIFSGKNQLEIPQIFFFSGVGACFLVSRRLTILH
jgi:tRNA(Ile)-lysidine synthase TilS/MesJ